MLVQKAMFVKFEKFRSAILCAKLYKSPNNSSLFIQRTSQGCTLLLLYVDDTIISGKDDMAIKELKTYLMQTFKMKDFEHLTYFLCL